MKNKVWIITGASSGFGRALAEAALAHGDRVIGTARDPKALADLVAQDPARVKALQLDVTKPDQIRSAFAEALKLFGQIDVLVNNAGFSMVGAVEETTEPDLRTVMETMFFGPVALTRELLPHLREQRSGTIVQLTSVGGLVTSPGFGPYCAAKHALEALSEALAAEVEPFGIRVLIVEPGAFRTSLFGDAFRALPEHAEYKQSVGPTREYVRQQAGKQAGDPQKAARAIITAVEAEAPMLRLPLGADAVAGIRAKLAAVAADVDRNEAAANATAF